MSHSLLQVPAQDHERRSGGYCRRNMRLPDRPRQNAAPESSGRRRKDTVQGNVSRAKIYLFCGYGYCQ